MGTPDMDRYLVISSDCHAGLPNEQYREWLDPSYRDATRRSLQMRPDQIVDLTARGLALEPTDHTSVLHEDERRGGRDAETGDEAGVAVGVELEHGESTLLSDLDPRDEALHSPRRARAVPPDEHERRPRPRRRRLCGCFCLHVVGVPFAGIRETPLAVSLHGPTGILTLQ